MGEPHSTDRKIETKRCMDLKADQFHAQRPAGICLEAMHVRTWELSSHLPLAKRWGLWHMHLASLLLSQ